MSLRNMGIRTLEGAMVVLVSASLVVCAATFFSITEAADDDSANNACKGCQNTNPSGPNYCANITCSETKGSGKIQGHCGAPGQCKAEQATDLKGAMQALGMLKSLLDLLKGVPQPAGSGSGSSPPTGPVGCMSYSYVNFPSEDPCSIYTPSASTSDTKIDPFISETIFDSINGGSNINVNISELLNAETTEVETSSLENTGGQGTSSSTTAPRTSTSTTRLYGGVRKGGGGTTLLANLKQGLTEVAGFFGSGSNTFDVRKLSIMGRMCISRPWAAGFLPRIIAPSFFDNLCRWTGYQIGAVQLQPLPQNRSTQPSPKASTTKQGVVPDVVAEVDIWAEPPSVRLGTRTYIYWTAKGVISCKESGPSFSQNSLSGGASTVPISDASVFTIACITFASTTVTDSVTVNLAI